MGAVALGCSGKPSVGDARSSLRVDFRVSEFLRARKRKRARSRVCVWVNGQVVLAGEMRCTMWLVTGRRELVELGYFPFVFAPSRHAPPSRERARLRLRARDGRHGLLGSRGSQSQDSMRAKHSRTFSAGLIANPTTAKPGSPLSARSTPGRMRPRHCRCTWEATIEMHSVTAAVIDKTRVVFTISSVKIRPGVTKVGLLLGFPMPPTPGSRANARLRSRPCSRFPRP